MALTPTQQAAVDAANAAGNKILADRITRGVVSVPEPAAPPAAEATPVPTAPVTAPNLTATPQPATLGEPDTWTKYMQDSQAELAKRESAAGVLTSEEEAQIEKQALEEGAKYDILLKEAREKKRQGVATATIGAGQRGGFESTQFAGAAAMPREEINRKIQELRDLGVQVDDTAAGGGTFIGQGGALEKVVSAYDLNINNLEVQKKQAINTAREALKEARLTGKSDAFKRFKDMYELAVKSHNEEIDLAYKKAQTVKATQDYFKSQVQFTADSVANQIMGSLTGDPEKDSALIAENALAKGISSGDVLASLRKIQDEQSFYKSSDILAIAKTLPAGQTRTIKDPNTGRTYNIEGLADQETITVTADDGTVNILDKNTGEVVSKSKPGVGKTKTGPSMVSVNFPRMTQNVLYDKSGKQVGSAWSNPITGSTEYKDMAGNPIQSADVVAKGYTTVKKSGSGGGAFGSFEDVGSEEE